MAHRRTDLPIILLLFCIAAWSAAAPTQAQGDATDPVTELHLHAHNVGDQYWFALHGTPQDPNPPLTLRPGASFRIILNNTAHVAHNLHLGAPIDAATPLVEPGGRVVLDVTVPADATGASSYWCEPHRHLGMEAPLSYGATDLSGGSTIPGPPLLLLLLVVGAVVALLRQRA